MTDASVSRDHGNRIVRTLGGAVEATYAGQGIDIDVPHRIAKNRAGGTAGQTLRILAVHAHLR